MDGRAAVQDLKTSFNSALVEIGNGLASFGRALSAACGDGITYSRNTMRTSYSLVGQHTFPIEDELYRNDAGSPTPFKAFENKIGLGVLFLPVIVPTVISSFTWVPLIGNSITSAVKGFVQVSNLTSLDCSKKTFSYPTLMGIDTGNDHRGIMRNAYGAPGYLLGATLGLPIATMVGGWRVLKNSFHSFIFTWASMVDLATSNQKIAGQYRFKFQLEDNRRTTNQVLGVPGLILGGVAGAISAIAVVIARGAFNLIYHSAKSFKSIFSFAWNRAISREHYPDGEPVYTHYMLLEDYDNRDRVRKYAFGGIGYILGAVAGGIAALSIFAIRGVFNLFYHSGRSFGRTFAQLWNGAVTLWRDPNNHQRIPLSSADTRHEARQFLFGRPGFYLGVVVGGIAAACVFAVRGVFNLFYHSAISFGRTFAHGWNLATSAWSNNNDYNIELAPQDQRHVVKKFLLGFPGYVPGVIAGGIAAVTIFAVRGVFNLFYHSARSFGRTFAEIWNAAVTLWRDPHNHQRIPLSSADTRHEARQFLFGRPGFYLGVVVGGIAAACVFAVRGVFNLFYHSAISFGRTFAHGWNLATSAWRKNNDYNIALAPQDQRHVVKKFLFGGPAYLVGVIAGGIAAVTIFAVRGVFNLFYHSARSFGRTFAEIWNASVTLWRDPHNHQRIPLSAADTRHETRQFLFGRPGFYLGVVVGGVAALSVFAVRGVFNLFYQSARSFGRTFANLWNFAITHFQHHNGKFKIPLNPQHDERNFIRAFVFGGPGYVIGAVIGLITATVSTLLTFSVGVLYHSGLSLARTFASIWNVATSIGRDNVNNPNLAIPYNQNDTRKPIEKYLLGGVGYALGFATGSIAALAIFAVRGVINLFYHSAISLGRTFAKIWNAAVTLWRDPHNRQRIPLSAADTRHEARQFLFGRPGFYLGVVVGSIAAVAVFAVRGIFSVLDHSARSLGRTFATLWNAAVTLWRSSYNQQRIPLAANDPRHAVEKFLLGGPGYLLGVITGGVAALSVFAVRGVFNLFYHSARSFGRTFAEFWNVAVTLWRDPHNHQRIPLSSADTRHEARQFLFGRPGFYLGVVVGSIAAVAVFAVRGIFSVLDHSARSLGRTYATLWNVAVTLWRSPYNHQRIPLAANDPRHAVEKYLLGGPGYLLGVITGGVAALSVFAVRGVFNLFYHSARSFGRTFAEFWNAAVTLWRDPHNRQRIPLSSADKRHEARQFLFGRPGFYLGVVVGGIAAVAVFAVRGIFSVLKNSAHSLGRTFAQCWNTATSVWRESNPQAIPLAANDPRHAVEKYLLGGPGYLLGVITGGIAALSVFAIRGVINLIQHSAISLGRTFAHCWNFATSDELDIYGNKKYKIKLEENDSRHAVQKYLFGGIGYILGAVVGGITALAVWSVRATLSFTKNSWFSFRALSGSLINGAAHRHWLEGLGGDTRKGDEKAFGLLGYAAAATVVAPLACFAFLAKKSPIASVAVIFVAFSPVTALFKLAGLLINDFKLENNVDSQIINKFKNLFGSLNATGQFTPGTTLKTMSNGNASAGLFITKSLKLNINSLTENVLKSLRKAYYSSHDKAAFFTSDQFNATINELKAKYTVGAFGTKQDMYDDHQKIDMVADFVRDYITNDNDTVPANLYIIPDRMTWGQNFRQTFWGGKLPDKQKAVSSQNNFSHRY